jgi:signal peptidase I
MKQLLFSLILVLTFTSCENSVDEDILRVGQLFTIPPATLDCTLSKGDFIFVVKSDSDNVQQQKGTISLEQKRVEFCY